MVFFHQKLHSLASGCLYTQEGEHRLLVLGVFFQSLFWMQDEECLFVSSRKPLLSIHYHSCELGGGVKEEGQQRVKSITLNDKERTV